MLPQELADSPERSRFLAGQVSQKHDLLSCVQIAISKILRQMSLDDFVAIESCNFSVPEYPRRQLRQPSKYEKQQDWHPNDSLSSTHFDDENAGSHCCQCNDRSGKPNSNMPKVVGGFGGGDRQVIKNESYKGNE